MYCIVYEKGMGNTNNCTRMAQKTCPRCSRKYCNPCYYTKCICGFEPIKPKICKWCGETLLGFSEPYCNKLHKSKYRGMMNSYNPRNQY
jgi:hypothetical protein